MFTQYIVGLILVTVASSRDKGNDKYVILFLMLLDLFLSEVNKWHLMLWDRKSYYF
jgi:hypothetical protein